MPVYLIEYSYTSDAWHALVTGAAVRDRHQAVEPLLRRLGGCFPRLIFECDPPIVVRDKFVAFGESDVVAFVYFPDNERAAAFAMAILAGGGVKSFKTTPLISLDDAIEKSMKAAQEALAAAGYVPPQGPRKP
jgi:hypothetical protein